MSGIGRQNMKQNQKLVQDVNFSHQILFSMMSALESVVNCAKGVDPKSSYASKLFTFYDRVDFSKKSYSELLSQLQIQIILCKNSRIMLRNENPDYVWQMPNNFNENAAENLIQDYLRALREQKDTHMAVDLAEDALKLIKGEYNKTLSAQKMEISCSKEKKKNRQLVDQVRMATDEIDKRQKQVEHINDPRHIPARLNNNQKKHQQNDIPQPLNLTQKKQVVLLVRKDLKENWKPQENSIFDEKKLSTYFYLFQSKESMNQFIEKFKNSKQYIQRMKKDEQYLKLQIQRDQNSYYISKLSEKNGSSCEIY